MPMKKEQGICTSNSIELRSPEDKHHTIGAEYKTLEATFLFGYYLSEVGCMELSMIYFEQILDFYWPDCYYVVNNLMCARYTHE